MEVSLKYTSNTCASNMVKSVSQPRLRIHGQMVYRNTCTKSLDRCYTAEIDTADSVTPNYIDVFLDNAAWAICSTYHTVLEASPGAAIFGQDMLFNIRFMADWHKIGEHRQSLTDRGNQRENA